MKEIDRMKVDRDYFATELQAEHRLENRSFAALQWLGELFATMEKDWREAGAPNDRIDTIQFAASLIEDAIWRVKRSHHARIR